MINTSSPRQTFIFTSSMITAIVIIVIVAILLFLMFRNDYELYHLRTVRYEISSEKIAPEDSLRCVMLADLHDCIYGEHNRDLLLRVKEAKPDLILFAGDMVTSSRWPDFREAEKLFRAFTEIAPVYYAKGNHEKKMSMPDSPACEPWKEFQKKLEEMGIVFLDNREIPLNSSIVLAGLDTDFQYYKKVKRIFYPPEQMKKDLAEADRTRFNIVLAHNPRFFRTYETSGRDLFLSGHYHGGAIRIFGKIGVISPQFRPFPRYSRGLYRKRNTAMLVTGGCGSHKVNLRIHNQPEVVVIDLHGTIV